MNLAHVAAIVLTLNVLAYRVRAEPLYAVTIGLFATAIWLLALYAAWLDSQARMRAEDHRALARRAVRRVVVKELAAIPFRSVPANDQVTVTELPRTAAA